MKFYGMKPRWPKEPVSLPAKIGEFHDRRFGPLIGLFPRKFKTTKKLRQWPPVKLALACGKEEKEGRIIRIVRVDDYLSDPSMNFLFFLGIGHFRDNPYRQRSPYVFMYDDQLWCRITCEGWKPRYPFRAFTVWMRNESGRNIAYSSSSRSTRPVYIGLYPINVDDYAKEMIEKRFNRAIKSLASTMRETGG